MNNLIPAYDKDFKVKKTTISVGGYESDFIVQVMGLEEGHVISIYGCLLPNNSLEDSNYTPLKDELGADIQIATNGVYNYYMFPGYLRFVYDVAQIPESLTVYVKG